MAFLNDLLNGRIYHGLIHFSVGLIQFTKASYNVNEDEQAEVEIEFTSGGIRSPVTIQLVNIDHFMNLY